jgi:ABC-type Zn uptake system ZnuABC Zn-binding protein ZnuA
MRGARRLAPLCLALAVVPAAPGCGEDSSGGAEPTAVATTTHVGDLVRNVGGGRVEVDTILGPEADPHDYEPRPSDVTAIGGAEVVFKSGGDLDEWLDELVDEAGAEDVVTLIDAVRTRPEGGEVDPHWWQDPRNAVLAVRAIEQALAEADPGGRARYLRQADAYVRSLRALDRRIAACMRKVPRAERKLVTTHDALGYFADRYDIEVVGAVIPALTTQAQPSARDVQRLVDQIEAEGVKAIFPETALSQKLEEAISRESGAQVGDPLWADSLGPEGSAGDTYLKAMAANAAAMVDGMTGGRVSCRTG